MSWTIGLQDCNACDGAVAITAAAVRGALTDADSCVLFSASTDSLQLPDQQIALREGELVSLVASCSCTTTVKQQGGDCDQLGEACARDLGLEGARIDADAAALDRLLCQTPDEQLTQQCCDMLMHQCIMDAQDPSCLDAANKCIEMLGLRELSDFSPDNEALATVFERVCVYKLSPLDDGSRCCQQVRTCKSGGQKPGEDSSCTAWYGSSTVEVDFSSPLSLSLGKQVSCDQDPDALELLTKLRPCESGSAPDAS